MSQVVDRSSDSPGGPNIRALPVENRQRSVPPADNDTQAAIAKYVRIALRYKWSIAAFALVGLAIGALKATNAVPVYRAEATVAIGPDYSNIVPGQNLNLYYAASWRFYATQYQMIQSRSVAERVVEKLGLVYRKNVNQPPESKPDLVQAVYDFLGLDSSPAGKPSTVELAMDIMSPEQLQRRKASLASMIQGGISVGSSERSQIISIRFDSPNPAFAAEVANGVVDAYIELGLEARLDRTRRTSTWLTEQLDDLRSKLAKSEQLLQDFRKREGVVASESMKEIAAAKLKFLNDAVVEARKAVADLSERYGPKHPKMITAKAELGSAQQRLEAASKKIVHDTQKRLKLKELERDVDANRELYQSFLEKFEQTDLSAQYTITNTRIIDPARVPRSAYKPNRNEFLMQWGAIGLICGVLLSLFREQLHNTFRTNEDIEQKLALPVLGVVPLLDKKGKQLQKSLTRKQLRKARHTAPERYYLQESKSAFAEAINHVRTGINYSDVDNPPRVVLISSAVQGEGKTTLATNLALSFAQLGRTLLIDADLRKPRVAEATGVKTEGGLVDYVAGIRSLQQCMAQDPGCQSLYILKSGTVPPNPLELLSSQTLAKTLVELRQKFSHILIDSAPILPVSDAIVLGHIVDAMLVVVQAERTTTKMVRDAMKRLENAGIRPMGAVLAQVQVRRSAYYYDGKYQYYYGGYYRSSDPASA